MTETVHGNSIAPTFCFIFWLLVVEEKIKNNDDNNNNN